MKRFLLFCGPGYYPSGGAKDLVGSYDSVGMSLLSLTGDWAHVLDIESGEIVAEWVRIDEGTKLGAGGWVTRDEYRQRWRDFEASQ